MKLQGRGNRGGGPGGAESKRRLGQVLVDRGFISREDLARALEEQRRTDRSLRELLARAGGLEPEALSAALAGQGALLTLEDALEAAGRVRGRLGDLLVRARRIAPEELERALAEQARTGEKLGGVLVRLGVISGAERDALLAFQKGFEGGWVMPAPFRLGEILVSMKAITREQLEHVLSLQVQGCPRTFRELLVEAGTVSPGQLSRALRIQERLVTAALVAVLGLASTGSASAGGGSVAVTLTATVPARSELRVIGQIAGVEVTAEDIARGYAEVPSGSRVEIRTNNRTGYLLVFDRHDDPNGPCSEIVVLGLGREARIGPGGGWIAMPGGRGVVSLELGYRLLLKKGALPGFYPWPVVLSARPL